MHVSRESPLHSYQQQIVRVQRMLRLIATSHKPCLTLPVKSSMPTKSTPHSSGSTSFVLHKNTHPACQVPLLGATVRYVPQKQGQLSLWQSYTKASFNLCNIHPRTQKWETALSMRAGCRQHRQYGNIHSHPNIATGKDHCCQKLRELTTWAVSTEECPVWQHLLFFTAS